MAAILLVDDDPELCRLLVEYLSREGFRVDVRHDGDEGCSAALGEDHDLIILDVMLPGMNGFDVLRVLRTSIQTPVIMLTARGEDVDRIVGLEMGADDYLAKPFNPRELTARIRAVMRRTAAYPSVSAEPAVAPPVILGDLQLDLGGISATVQGRAVPLTGAEFYLLAALVEQAGAPVSREQLAREVLGRELGPWDRSIDVHMSNLRKKLGPGADGGSRIRAVRGEGYMILSAGASGGNG
jgi:two-component system response regulator CpxR